MALPRAQRIEYKRFLADLTDQPNWDYQGVQILLDDFGLEYDSDPFNAPDLVPILSKVSDETLEEMYRVATGTPEQAREMEKASEVWRNDQFRLFISHLTREKRFVMAVSDALANYGIHGFVAHEHLPTEKNWGESLQDALRSMHAFFALVHPEFKDSVYCGQEVGWALGRNVPARFLRFGENPPGFASALQSPDMMKYSSNASKVAEGILDWLADQEELKERLHTSLLIAIKTANSFDRAGAICRAIVKCDSMTKADWATLNSAYHENGQVGKSGTANAALEPMYLKHGQLFPPPPF